MIKDILKLDGIELNGPFVQLILKYVGYRLLHVLQF